MDNARHYLLEDSHLTPFISGTNIYDSIVNLIGVDSVNYVDGYELTEDMDVSSDYCPGSEANDVLNAAKDVDVVVVTVGEVSRFLCFERFDCLTVKFAIYV